MQGNNRIAVRHVPAPRREPQKQFLTHAVPVPATTRIHPPHRRIVLNPVDVDGVYGLTQEELVPLPFDAPKVLVSTLVS